MRHGAKTLALLGLCSVIVLGLLYWRFSSSFPFVDRRSKTDIFAEAFGRHDFKHCYRLMSDGYKSTIPQSHFVNYLEREVAYPGRESDLFRRRLFGNFEKIGEAVNTRHRFTKRPLFPGSESERTGSIRYTVEHSHGRYHLHFITTDMNADSPIERFTMGDSFALSVLIPTPTPDQGPIS